jgi:hypothetical protein
VALRGRRAHPEPEAEGRAAAIASRLAVFKGLPGRKFSCFAEAWPLRPPSEGGETMARRAGAQGRRQAAKETAAKKATQKKAAQGAPKKSPRRRWRAR